jgi:hypothetical protein
MTGLLRTRRIVATGVALLLEVAACGDDDAADAERFCEIIAEGGRLNESLAGIDPGLFGVGVDPDEARDTVGEARNLIDQAATVAPDEIRPSFDVVADWARHIFDLVEEADFFVLQVDQAEFTPSAEVIAANDALAEWGDANCSSG